MQTQTQTHAHLTRIHDGAGWAICAQTQTQTQTQKNTRCANSPQCRMADWFRWLRLGGLVEVVYGLGFRWFSLGVF
jgi:hypothetical protein